MNLAILSRKMANFPFLHTAILYRFVFFYALQQGVVGKSRIAVDMAHFSSAFGGQRNELEWVGYILQIP